MILLKPWGGLGNQMFQYAAAYSLARRNEDEILIDTEFLDERSQPDAIVTHRNLELDKVFAIDVRHATLSERRRFGSGSAEGWIARCGRAIKRRISGSVTICEPSDQVYALNNVRKGNVCLVGGWQSERYFAEVAGGVRKMFKFRHPLSAGSAELLEGIRSSESVCIHVRRGDYVTSPKYKESIGPLDKSYYMDAIDFLRSEIKNPKFYIFSNDLEWCRMSFSEISNAVIVGDEYVGELCSNYLQLMSECRHFVISNSSFSWWAAWLGEDRGALIVAPEKWTRSGIMKSEKIVPERWKRIPNAFI